MLNRNIQSPKPMSSTLAQVDDRAHPGPAPRRYVARQKYNHKMLFSDYSQRMAQNQVDLVRRFNRVVTQRIGALDGAYLSRGRSLGLSRLLWEIESAGSEVRLLRARLGLDSAITLPMTEDTADTANLSKRGDTWHRLLSRWSCVRLPSPRSRK